MPNRIIICGGNGAGKSTLGKELAYALKWTFKDIEDYYFPAKNAEYSYAKARTYEEVKKLLLEDMKKHENFILAAVKGNYGDEVVSMFTCAVFVNVPKETRMKRVWERSYKKFGERMLEGGDLYEKEKSFFDMVEKRSDKDVIEWLDSVNIPVIQVDGTKTAEENIEIIKRELEKASLLGEAVP
ncbi:MAG: AAA family ATPase [Clostridia bacterium]|nr:AAA family ATPase [Clostridia bacterium]